MLIMPITAQHPRHQLIWQITAEQGNGRHRPGAQQEGPQQQRSLVRAPDRGDLVHVRGVGYCRAIAT